MSKWCFVHEQRFCYRLCALYYSRLPHSSFFLFYKLNLKITEKSIHCIWTLINGYKVFRELCIFLWTMVAFIGCLHILMQFTYYFISYVYHPKVKWIGTKTLALKLTETRVLMSHYRWKFSYLIPFLVYSTVLLLLCHMFVYYNMLLGAYHTRRH